MSVQALLLYTYTFGYYSNSLFPFIDGHPVSYSVVTKQVIFTVSFIALHLKLYQGDSFYIDVATYAANGCFSLEDCFEGMELYTTYTGQIYLLYQSLNVTCV